MPTTDAKTIEMRFSVEIAKIDDGYQCVFLSNTLSAPFTRAGNFPRLFLFCAFACNVVASGLRFLVVIALQS